MATQTLTEVNFDEVVNGNDVVFICFCDSSSDACRSFAPTFEASSNEHADVVYGTVDVEAEQGLAAAANISRSPTIMAYRKGVLGVLAAGRAAPADPGGRGHPGKGN